MKIFIYITIGFILFFSTGCTNKKNYKVQQNEANIQSENNPKKIHEIDSILNSLVGNKETAILYIDLENNDTVSFPKEIIRQTMMDYPELYLAIPQHPDLAYAISRYKENYDKDIRCNWTSEVGQDNYYILYAYLLKHRNGLEKYKKMRDTLIQIYREINGINADLAEGGTYYAHQYRRIQGFAEYSIYRYKSNIDWFTKKYPISSQKSIFIKALKKYIEEEETNLYNTDKSSRIERKAESDAHVTKIDSLITNYFYLKMAQEFQYSNY